VLSNYSTCGFTASAKNSLIQFKKISCYLIFVYYIHGINIIMSYNVIMSCNVVNVMIVYIEYRTFFITVGPPGTTRVPDP
jgi:hypothetical protein